MDAVALAEQQAAARRARDAELLTALADLYDPVRVAARRAAMRLLADMAPDDVIPAAWLDERNRLLEALGTIASAVGAFANTAGPMIEDAMAAERSIARSDAAALIEALR